MRGVRTASESDQDADDKSTARDPGAAVSESVERLNNLMQSVRRELRFSIDEESGHTVIKVIDSDTQQVIRHIPPEDVMTMAERLEGVGPGLMMDVRA